MKTQHRFKNVLKEEVVLVINPNLWLARHFGSNQNSMRQNTPASCPQLTEFIGYLPSAVMTFSFTQCHPLTSLSISSLTSCLNEYKSFCMAMTAISLHTVQTKHQSSYMVRVSETVNINKATFTLYK